MSLSTINKSLPQTPSSVCLCAEGQMAWFDSFQHFDTFILSTAFVKSAASSAIYLQ